QGDLLGALDEAPADVVQGGGADVGGGGGERVPHGVRGGHGLFDLGVGGHADRADDPAVPGRGDVEVGLAGGLAAGEPEGVGGSHGVPALPRWWVHGSVKTTVGAGRWTVVCPSRSSRVSGHAALANARLFGGAGAELRDPDTRAPAGGPSLGLSLPLGRPVARP